MKGQAANAGMQQGWCLGPPLAICVSNKETCTHIQISKQCKVLQVITMVGLHVACMLAADALLACMVHAMAHVVYAHLVMLLDDFAQAFTVEVQEFCQVMKCNVQLLQIANASNTILAICTKHA